MERLNEVRYRAGSIPLQIWLDSQETRRQARVGRGRQPAEPVPELCRALQGAEGATPTRSAEHKNFRRMLGRFRLNRPVEAIATAGAFLHR